MNGINKNRGIRLIVVTLLTLVLMLGMTSVSTFAASKVVIGHAATGENGTKNNKAGDQTGKEVYTMAWVYNSSASSARHWTVVLRCKDSAKAKKIAQVIKDACENNHVGYDQATKAERQSFYYALKDANWDASKITKDVETTCTPMIAAAVNAAGITIKTDHSASSLEKALMGTGYFEEFTSSSYVASDAHLLAGDILLSTGSHQHGATVVYSPNSTDTNAVDKKVASESSSGNYVAGKDYVTTVDLNIRYGPGTNYGIKLKSELTADGQKNALSGTKAVLKAGTVVTCIKSSGNWINIPSGWICGKSGSTSYVKAKATTSSNSTTSTVKVGKKYKLLKDLYIRKGPGTNYSIVKRSNLTASCKKHCYNWKYARYKKGSVVTCKEVKGDWLRCVNGWVCCKPGNMKAV